MLCFPNCKINIGLYVTDKRADGFHNLETVFYPVAVSDVLEIIPAGETSLTVTGNVIQGSEADNLVMKAYRLLNNRFPEKVPTLQVLLHKVIPSGAGLGGGSSDGAFMLKLINEFCQLSCPSTLLEELALQLGSDCPFFIRNTPVFASGRGEVFEDCSLDLSSLSIQVVVPEVYISTAAAFSGIKPRPAPFDLRKLNHLPIADWRNHISNDFETTVFEKYPELADIKSQLYDQGAIYASMSGSGSALYGIFPKGAHPTFNSPYRLQLFNSES